MSTYDERAEVQRLKDDLLSRAATFLFESLGATEKALNKIQQASYERVLTKEEERRKDGLESRFRGVERWLRDLEDVRLRELLTQTPCTESKRAEGRA